MGYFEGRKVFLTGGSKGIGRAAALQLVAQGADVYIAARGKEALDETLAAMGAAKVRDSQVLGAVTIDVTDQDSVDRATQEALAGLGGLDTLLCNSGYAHCATIADAPFEDFQRLLDVNYLGHVRVVRAMLPTLTEQGHGDICLTSSLLGIFGSYGYAAYSASKFAIVGFAESLKQEMMFHNVRVSMFLPTTTDTPGLARENADKPPITHAMEADSSFNKTYTADQAAEALLKTIEKGRLPGFVGFDSKLIDWLKRHVPGIYWWALKGELNKAVKKVESGWKPAS